MAALSVTLFVAATAARWGTMSLAAVGGAQTVLGVGGSVGPAAAALSAWLVAAGLLLTTPPCAHRLDSVVLAVVAGAAAAFVIAGPAGVDGALVRVAATGIGAVLAYGVTRVPVPGLAVTGPVVAAAGAVLALR